MRFLAEGPSIPDELLVARDEGRVVFFCGAGVSRARAGLSDFLGLAQSIIDTLGATTDSPTRKIFDEARQSESRTGISGLIPIDRIFGLLEREFMKQDIEIAVAKALKPSIEVDLSAHRIMLDLAKAPNGTIRIVTTNFDLLFEACDSSLLSSSHPKLPDPLNNADFKGIIHLHGRVDKDYTGPDGNGFILSSSDFGRAYLSDGWATKFISTILERYYVVFVGYAADDPPVQYLLEALRVHLETTNRVYAFQSGSVGEAEAKWRYKGVIPITYTYDELNKHKALWDTLEEWVNRARDPKVWYDKLISQARKGPEELLPHERGQIAHIVSTIDGIRQFATSNDPPPAEWLCVFDPVIRYSKPGPSYKSGDFGHYFDPFIAYGLDSDPVPPMIDPNDYSAKRETPDNAWNCFTITRVDQQNLTEDNYAALKGHWSINIPRLPTRLWLLCVWISKVSNQPTTVWWASAQTGIHPELKSRICFEFTQIKKDYSPNVRQAWRYIFEAWEIQKNESKREWYELKALITLDGWTNTVIREFASIFRPYLKVKRTSSSNPKPPENKPDILLREMIDIDVQHPTPEYEVEIPDEILPIIIREFRRNLEYAVSLEKELNGYELYHLCSIEPTPDLEGSSPSRKFGISKYFLYFVYLFKILIDKNPQAAKQEYLSLWVNDETLFARLRIWVAGEQRILTSEEAGKIICDLDDKVFWDRLHQGDLLQVLAKRWNDF
jgi:hypothetical protein